MSSPLLSSIDRVHEGAPHRVKDEEKALLFRQICAGRSPTRQGLARRLDIRPSSVSEAVQELVDDGLVIETQAAVKRNAARSGRGKSGRPQLTLAPRADRFVAISVYVDSRELKAVLVTMQEEVLAEEVRVLPPGAANREVKAALLDLLKRLPARVPSGCELVGAGLSLVGKVNALTRTWVGAARWPRLKNLDLGAVESRLDFPLLIRRTNESELEYFLDCTPAARRGTALLLHWGFGIGSAVAFRGGLLTSSLGWFGEIGHTPVCPGSDAPCLCGSRGCLETVAALWSMMPVLTAALGELPEDEKKLAPLLGDPRLLRLPRFKQALTAMQGALLALSMVFYPDWILLSGPFTENPGVFRRFADGFRGLLPAHAQGAMSLSTIPVGMPGCRRGGANPLFRAALARALRRRT
jgi:transcriptional regulator of PTS gene